MTLFVSDAHLGRGSRGQTREAERALVALIEAHADEILDGGRLVLHGDLFDQWIEYKHLAPKQGLRLLGALARLADAGAEIHYLVGNRDPWHVDWVEGEVGVRVWRDAWEAEIEGVRAYIAHGDGLRPPENPVSRLFHRLQPLVRHPRVARLYRTGLPGDGGYAFARWVSHTFGSDGSPDPDAARRVDAAAHAILETTDRELVVFGHSHTARLNTTPHGTYLNTGYWFGARTFGRLDEAGPALLRWTGSAAEPLSDLEASA